MRSYLLIAFLLSPIYSSTAADAFSGSLFCEECAGGHCWDYSFEFRKSKDGENPEVDVAMNGFQMAEQFKARAAIEKGTAEIYVQPTGYPVMTLFTISYRKKYFLKFLGVQSSANSREVRCELRKAATK